MTSKERIARAEKNSLNNWNEFVNLGRAGQEQGIGWDAEGRQYSFLRGCSKPTETQRQAYERTKAEQLPMPDLDFLARIIAGVKP